MGRFATDSEATFRQPPPPRRNMLVMKTGAPSVVNSRADWLNPFTSTEIVSQLELEDNNSCLFLSIGILDPTFFAVAFIYS